MILLIQRFGEDLVFGELKDILHPGIILQTHSARGIRKGQKFRILRSEHAPFIRRHRRPVGRSKRGDQLLKLLAGERAYASRRRCSGACLRLASALQRENSRRHRHRGGAGKHRGRTLCAGTRCRRRGDLLG